jgi:TonB dependent receptor
MLAVACCPKVAMAQPAGGTADPTRSRAEDPREAFGFAPKSDPAGGCDLIERGAASRADDQCALSQDPLGELSPLALSTWISSADLLRLPGADALHDRQAAVVVGVGRDDGGLMIAGASSLENRWTVDGAVTDSVRTSGAETRLPLPFLSGLRVTSGGFSARDRASSGGVIDAELLRAGSEPIVAAYAWAGAQTVRRNRPPLEGTYSSLRGRVVDPRSATVTVVASGPIAALLGGRAWYAAGVAATVTDISLERTGLRLVDRDNDGEVDLGGDGGFVTETISRDSIAATASSVPVMARVGFDRPEQSLDVSLLGQWAKTSRFTAVATPEAVAVDRKTLVLDGIATWRRRWADTAVRAQVAWHRSARDEDAASAGAGDAPQLQTAFVPPGADIPQADARFVAACRDDGDDRYPKIPNCPVPTGWFARDGVGLLTEIVSDRPSLSVDAVRAVGRHALRVGVSAEDARMVITSRYSGGTLIRSLFTGHRDQLWFVDPIAAGPCSLDVDLECPTVPQVELIYRTRHAAGYVEDSWRPRPDLLIDAGLRWEFQQLGSRLRFDNNLAPRAGVAWDPIGGGRSRIAATFGRFFTHLAAGLGEDIDKSPATVRDTEVGDGRSRAIDFGSLTRVLPGTDPMVTDEVTFSAALAWPQLGQVRAHSQQRWLRSGFEDTLDGFGNPAAASRRIDIVGLEFATAALADPGVRIGYSYGRARGSLVGAFDARRGTVRFGSSDFDQLITNTSGRLPSDLGHRFYADLTKQRRWGPLWLEVGARFSLENGRPRDVLADSSLWGPVYLLPRGSDGRFPTLLTTDLRVAARWAGSAVSVQIFNLFQREDVIAADEIYAEGLLSPIDGGDASDLPFLKTATGVPASRSLSYGTATNFQLPLSVVLGIESQF